MTVSSGTSAFIPFSQCLVFLTPDVDVCSSLSRGLCVPFLFSFWSLFSVPVSFDFLNWCLCFPAVIAVFFSGCVWVFVSRYLCFPVLLQTFHALDICVFLPWILCVPFLMSYVPYSQHWFLGFHVPVPVFTVRMSQFRVLVSVLSCSGSSAFLSWFLYFSIAMHMFPSPDVPSSPFLVLMTVCPCPSVGFPPSWCVCVFFFPCLYSLCMYLIFPNQVSIFSWLKVLAAMSNYSFVAIPDPMFPFSTRNPSLASMTPLQDGQGRHWAWSYWFRSVAPHQLVTIASFWAQNVK